MHTFIGRENFFVKGQVYQRINESCSIVIYKEPLIKVFVHQCWYVLTTIHFHTSTRSWTYLRRRIWRCRRSLWLSLFQSSTSAGASLPPCRWKHFYWRNNMSKTDVALWCYKWTDWVWDVRGEFNNPRHGNFPLKGPPPPLGPPRTRFFWKVSGNFLTDDP